MNIELLEKNYEHFVLIVEYGAFVLWHDFFSFHIVMMFPGHIMFENTVDPDQLASDEAI